jgi:hypothetical protein
MKLLWRQFAGIGILWAILVPVFLLHQELRDGQSVQLDLMARNLHSLLPKEPTNDKTLVSLPAQGVSNWAGVMHDLAVTEDRHLEMLAVVTSISSITIIILSVCILRTKRDENTAA